MSTTVIEYVLSRLYELGIHDIFGVPGDYAFPIEDAICADKRLRWIGNCNELNAAYAADAYARTQGLAALSTTFGVGELSAINGIAGACAESVTLFHLVGMPASHVQAQGERVHHTLGNGYFTAFYEATASFVCARAIMTPENCIAETERLIAAALRYRKPVYMAFPSDYATMPIVVSAAPQPVAPVSDPLTLNAVIDVIAERLNNSDSVCALPGIYLARHGAQKAATALIDAANLPFATMMMDKCVIDESHPNYVGMYVGQLMDQRVRQFVESSDCVLQIGTIMSDFNTGAFTSNLDEAQCISVEPESVRIGKAVYENVLMKDVLNGLVGRGTRRARRHDMPTVQGIPAVSGSGKLTAEYLYARWQQMLKPNDRLVAETGTTSMGLAFAQMPQGAVFYQQTLWGSIGWATPAAFGVAMAEPEKRTILITGEGSHQMTAQEIGQFYRFGLKPLIFVVNNSGYLVERMLCKDGDIYYNDLAQWDYSQLPAGLGCRDWFTARVTTCEALDEAIRHAEAGDCGAYIEVVTDKYVTSELLEKMHGALTSLYSA